MEAVFPFNSEGVYLEADEWVSFIQLRWADFIVGFDYAGHPGSDPALVSRTSDCW